MVDFGINQSKDKVLEHSNQLLKWNAGANFIGLAYTTVIGIVFLPLFLDYLGPEAFGLFGFFMLLQALMQLLDIGMSPMLSRQASLVRGKDIDFLGFKKLLRSLEIVFLCLMLVTVVVFFFSNAWIVDSWINLETLDTSKVTACVTLMGAIIGLRFFSVLYRSGIQGIEHQVWLNFANMVLVTIKFVGSLILLHFVTRDIRHFFEYQLLIGVVELFVLGYIFYQLLPATPKVGFRFFWPTIKPFLPFAGGIAYATIIWVILTQLDKLILSTILPLSQYGYFALAMVVSAGIAQISSPISQAILPRMTYLLSRGQTQEMLLLYRKSTQFMSIVMFSLTGVVANFSTELLYVWTGDMSAAEWAGPILFWYALGNGVLAISAFQYYLQFAHGKLRMHVIYNTISASIQIPVIMYAALEWGATGVALTWFILRLVSFVVWIPIVHRKFAPGIHKVWLLKDVLPFLVCTLTCLAMVRMININFFAFSRVEIFTFLVGIGLVLFVVNLTALSDTRNVITGAIRVVLFKIKRSEKSDVR
jgi:O-antigen/teichoic acid export membrane protein